MKLQTIEADFSVCKIEAISEAVNLKGFFFLSQTDEELSLVCETSEVPAKTLEREDDWKGFRIVGILDFSLIGILSKLSSILADNQIGIFAVSTYNTDYILVKKEQFSKAIRVLQEAGYETV